MKKLIYPILCISLFINFQDVSSAQQKRMRDWCGSGPGVMKTGQWNAITDVPGVKVGHVTLKDGKDMCTGVTAIVPHEGNLYNNKVPAAVYVGNGYGKLAGSTQVMELGNIEAPIVLTNTLNVAEGISGIIEWTLKQPGNEGVLSVNSVVGETNDGTLNDIRSRFVKPFDVVKAIETASSGPVEEGCVGAGTGTIAFGVKGGIGTSSRVLPASMGGYTVGVIVQTNYGGILEVDGVPVGQLTNNYFFKDNILADVNGSCMIVVATDAPVDSRNLERIAKRAIMGLAKTGGIAADGSGDYAIAFSVCPDNLIKSGTQEYHPTLLQNSEMSGIFMATIEAVEEALWDSLFCAETTAGTKGRVCGTMDKKTVAKWIKSSHKAVGLDQKQSKLEKADNR